MNKRIGMMLLLAALSVGTQAKVRLHHLIGDNMVVQAASKVNLWGWDTPGKTVRVEVSWSAARYSTVTDAQGKWLVQVETPEASYTPLSITFDDGEKTTINQVLAGQVWACGGQSNMEMPVRGFGNCPVDQYNQVVADAVHTSSIRYAKLKRTQSMTPLEDNDCHWEKCDPAHVGNASATGYFFARLLHQMLDQPIGLIEANQGGTAVEGWLDYDNLKKHTSEELDSVSIFKKNFMARQLVWGNGTFHPILNYTVKGIIYYQGCSNVGRAPEKYAERLVLLAEQWRNGFGLGNIPFYFVEIAPYWYDDANGTAAAFLREQQAKAVELIPNSAMVSTNDCVYPWEMRQIHPAQKQKVGERLAYHALTETYGFTGFISKSPRFQEMKIEGNQIYVKLTDTADGIYPIDGIQGFEVAGEDRVFHPAQAHVDWGKGLVVSCPEVAQPVALRYCYRNFLLGNLVNQGGLPLVPFRTDQW